MQYNTEFYKLLRQAVYDDTALVRVLDKIMKLINSNSKDDDGEINEDLKSELITYSIELIRNKKISNTSLESRILNFFQKIKNPYAIRVGNIVVEMEFSDNSNISPMECIDATLINEYKMREMSNV